MNKKIILKNFINHNNKVFRYKKNNTNNKIFLIEFNGCPFIHIIFSYLTNFFKNQKNYRVISYESFELLNKNKQNFVQRISWLIGTKLGINTFNIFKSIGVDSFIRPKYSLKIEKESKKIFKKYSKNLTHAKLENLILKKIWVGDLIYDSFLKKNNLSTIKSFKDVEFLNFFQESIKFFLFWEDYFIKNNIGAICGCHEVYLTGIPLRIASFKNVKTLLISNLSVVNISKRMDFNKKENLENFKVKIYKKLLKKDILINGKKKINLEEKKILTKYLTGKKRIFYMKKNY